jgi:sporulation protein YlmC with PRC-barrel domain
MRLTDLLGRRVVDAHGNDIGGVADVRLVQDGPLQPSMQAALRVDGLIVVEKHATQLFGYERHVAPALLRWIVHRRLGAVWFVPWSAISTVGDQVEIRESRDSLQLLEKMARYPS